ncbi:MAG: hypothetical protein PHC68_04100 [Syntrophorhabdaceae bacterium]|nr:hypothetical protein [Syntrophorhabdaceae bacterium]
MKHTSLERPDEIIDQKQRMALEVITELLLKSRGEQMSRYPEHDTSGMGTLRLDEIKVGMKVIHPSSFTFNEKDLVYGTVESEPFVEEPVRNENGALISPSGHIPGAKVVKLVGIDKPVNAHWLIPIERKKHLLAVNKEWNLTGMAISMIGDLLGGPVWAPKRRDGNDAARNIVEEMTSERH